jgi:hypothetical protein
MGIGGKIPNRWRMPVIPPRKTARVIHALLHDRPLALSSDYKIVQINLEAVGDGIVIDSCRKPAGADQRLAVEALAFGNRS